MQNAKGNIFFKINHHSCITRESSFYFWILKRLSPVALSPRSAPPLCGHLSASCQLKRSKCHKTSEVVYFCSGSNLFYSRRQTSRTAREPSSWTEEGFKRSLCCTLVVVVNCRLSSPLPLQKKKKSEEERNRLRCLTFNGSFAVLPSEGVNLQHMHGEIFVAIIWFSLSVR